jgi:hypothetical protein
MRLEKQIVRVEWDVTYVDPQSTVGSYHQKWASYETEGEAMAVAEQLNGVPDITSVRVSQHERTYTVRQTSHDRLIGETQLP